METEEDGMLPFLGKELLNQASQIETKLYVKPTDTGLLLHYNSHVEQTTVTLQAYYELCLIVSTVCPQHGFIIRRSVGA